MVMERGNGSAGAAFMCAQNREHRRSSVQVLADVHDVFALRGGLKPYRTDKEFQDDLQRVLEDGYGVTLIGVQLEEAATNINQFLKAFL